jgi:hypothetical protein
MLVLYADGALDADDARRVAEHLAGCRDCRAESEQILRIREWLTDPGLFEPVQDMTWQLLPEKLAGRARELKDRRWGLSALRIPKWALSAAALVVLACGLIWMMRLREPVQPVAQPALIAPGNEAFLNRVRTAYAREATSDYLTGCQGLLLDLACTEAKCNGDRYDVSLEVARARQLLEQKRRLDAELSVPGVARAKDLCDELERFLVNLSTAQTCETPVALHRMESLIEKEQLLLRIKVLQSGIS